MNVNVNETHPNFGVSHSHSKSSKLSGSDAQAQAQTQAQTQTQTQGPATRTRATKKRRLKPLQDVASTSTSLSPRPLLQQQQKVLFLYCPPPLFTFYFIINNNGVTNFSCWLHFHVGIIYYCYYIFSCSQNVNFVVVVRFCFLGESESTSKGLNETWYPFLLAVTNDFDLHNAIIVSSFTASVNINLLILGSTIKFFVVE